MEHIWLTVLGVSGLLTLAVLMWPVANRLNFPYTVMLAVVGCVIGYAEHALETANLGIVSDLLGALHALDITSETVLFVFLPALVFESALAIDVRRLMDDIAPILMLAVVGLLISTAVVGWALHGVSGYPLIACLLLGAIVSATDPVAVVAIFKDLGAPKRLAILVEGESLFNDATAIVVFTILSAMLLGQSDAGLAAGVLSFLKVFIGGVLVGYLLARLFALLMMGVGESALPKITLTLTLAYLSFLLAEHYLHVSGVMAVVTAALVLGARGRSILSQHAWHELEGVWEQVGFIANSVIFVLVGIAVPGIIGDITMTQLTWLVVLLVTAFVARFAIIFGMVPVLSRLGWAQHVDVGYRAVMFWGGLRGAVSLALALAVMENEAFSPEVRTFIGTLVTGFVLFTLAVNATTVQLVMRMFGLDKLSPVDAAVRDRVLVSALGNICDNLHSAALSRQMRSGLADSIARPYEERARDRRQEADAASIGHRDWINVNLRKLTLQEQQIYGHYFDQGLVSSDIARLLFSQSADLLDGIKSGGEEGYRGAYERALEFGWQTMLAAQLQRRFGLSGPLARLLGNRFEMLQANCMALRELAEDSTGTDLLDAEVSEEVDTIVQDRLHAHVAALECLKAAYPDYADRLEERLLGQIAVRLEHAHYQKMLSGNIISKEVYHDLVKALHQRASSDRPRLDLGLDADRLVAQMPYFADLPGERQREIARMLRPRLVLPGEQVITKGDKGDCMYFISSGAVQVEIEPEPVILGRGDFFGEMALLSDIPRVVSVTAEGFCDLLALMTRDFRTLLDAHPDLRDTIERVAAERS
ncbi:MAG: cation:proton antiporter [Xanthomonadales bacterium]|nr:cation:proton antiporter [Xanthomonadales bacterium]